MATGLWTFWSPFGRDVCGNVTDGKYIENCKKHIKFSNDSLQDEKFELLMFSQIDSQLCSCKVSELVVYFNNNYHEKYVSFI